MSVINKDLGVVTAYAYAVEAGYTGTEEEFEQALGDLAELVTDFENFTVEVTTLEPGSSATASYANGVLSLGIPEGEKGDTGATPNLTIGTVTTLAPGSDATATITGTDEAPVLSLGIPEGDPGEVPAAALASDFSASVSYKKGDYVWKSGTLYEFTADHAAGAWTGSDATAAKVADDVADLKSAINSITQEEPLTFETGNITTSGSIGDTASLSRTTLNSVVSAYMHCNAGDEFYLTGTPRDNNASCYYMLLDESLKILSKAERTGVAVANKKITATADGYIVVNFLKAYDYNATKGRNRLDTYDEILYDTEMVNLGFKHGNVNSSTGEVEWRNNKRVNSHVYIPVRNIDTITLSNGAWVALRFYDINRNYLSGTGWITSNITNGIIEYVPNGAEYVRVIGRYDTDAEIEDIYAFSSNLIVTCTTENVQELQEKFVFPENNTIFNTNTGNASIVCAKEHTYDTGNTPVIEWYILEEAGGTNRFFVSSDLTHKEFAFMFTGDAYKYSFGVLANGDIIAVLDASSIDWDDNGDVERSESFRQNPYVFLASENWSIQHEVDFGNALKPMGWFANHGFRVLPDGSAVFAEYTRYCVLTANVWKLNGDPTDANNWDVVISLPLPDPAQSTLLKHWHMVQYDPYAKVVYATTGDTDAGSSCYYSTDYGDTWTLLGTNSSKYFRVLNYIYTEDYIYWAKDWYDDAEHYLFRATRDANGILDMSSIVDYIHIPPVENLSTYATCYMPEIDAILLLEREDNGGITNNPAPIRLCDIANGTLHTVGYMRSAKGIVEGIGFRARYYDCYPHKCVTNVGWQMRAQVNANAVNKLDWFDSAGNDYYPSTYGLSNVNNLWLEVYKNADGYHLNVGTRYI